MAELLEAVMRYCLPQLWVADRARIDGMGRMLKVTKAEMTFIDDGLRGVDGVTAPRRRAINVMIDGREYRRQITGTPVWLMMVVKRRAEMPAGVKAVPLLRGHDERALATRATAFQPPVDAWLPQGLTSVALTATSRSARTLLQELIVPKEVFEEVATPRPARAAPNTATVLRLPTIPIQTYEGQVVL